MCKVWAWQKPTTTAIVSNRAHLSLQLSCFRHLQAQNIIITSLKPSVGSPSDRKYHVSSNLWCIPSLVSKGASVLRSLGHFPYFYTKTELENINAMKATYLWAGDAQARLSESLSFLYINSGTFVFVLEVKNPLLNYLYIRHPFQQVESIHISWRNNIDDDSLLDILSEAPLVLIVS